MTGADLQLALIVSVGVLPAFGITLTLLDWTLGDRPAVRTLLTLRAPWVYGAFLLSGVVAAALLGLLDTRSLHDPEAAWRVLLAFALVPLCAAVPYFVELAVSSRAAPAAASAVPLPLTTDAAQDAAEDLSESRAEWWSLAGLTAAAEEALFRATLLPVAAAVSGSVVALLASALVFGAHHIAFGAAAVIGKLVAGVTWGAVMLLAGTVLAPLAAHLLFQLLVWRRLRRRAMVIA